MLEDIELTDPNTRVTLIGEHIGNRTNEDVTAVDINFSITPFLFPEIFTTFTNMKSIEIFFSMLETLNIPDVVQLENILIMGNRFTNIRNNTFSTQSSLKAVNFVISGIESVEENAFDGLVKCENLSMIVNSLSELHPRTFFPLTNARSIDLTGNRLEIIQDELFSQNSKLEILMLENNRINAISPRFTAAFIGSLKFAFLSNNPCIDRNFKTEDDQVVVFMHSALRKCYNNFTGAIGNETRTTQLQFRGGLRINDVFENEILRLN
jgi:Leucine-rich repeat (LRR) protein